MDHPPVLRASAPPKNRTSATSSCWRKGQTGLVGRARPADPVRLRPDASDGALGDRQGRRVAVEPERSRDPVPDLDLAKISTSFTINGTAAIIYAMYLAVADKQGVPRDQLTGTIQNDILKEYVARGTWIFPVQAVDAAGRRLDPLFQRRFAALQPDQHRRRARARRRLHGGRGDGLHAGQRPGLRGRAAAPRRRRREVRQAAVVLLLRAHGLLRRDREVPRRPSAVGEA